MVWPRTEQLSGGAYFLSFILLCLIFCYMITSCIIVLYRLLRHKHRRIAYLIYCRIYENVRASDVRNTDAYVFYYIVKSSLPCAARQRWLRVRHTIPRRNGVSAALSEIYIRAVPVVSPWRVQPRRCSNGDS